MPKICDICNKFELFFEPKTVKIQTEMVITGQFFQTFASHNLPFHTLLLIPNIKDQKGDFRKFVISFFVLVGLP